jgi:hypothetical protein
LSATRMHAAACQRGDIRKWVVSWQACPVTRSGRFRGCTIFDFALE